MNVVPFRSKAEILVLEDQKLIESLKKFMREHDMTVSVIAMSDDGSQNVFFNKPLSFDNAMKIMGHLNFVKFHIYDLVKDLE